MVLRKKIDFLMLNNFSTVYLVAVWFLVIQWVFVEWDEHPLHDCLNKTWPVCWNKTKKKLNSPGMGISSIGTDL